MSSTEHPGFRALSRAFLLPVLVAAAGFLIVATVLSPPSYAGREHPSRVVAFGGDDIPLRLCERFDRPLCGWVFDRLSSGTDVRMNCWVDGSWAYRNYNSNRWFHVTAEDGTTGYVHSSYVFDQERVPHCGARENIDAARQAAHRFGQRVIPHGERRWVGNTAHWSGWCAGFASVAYKSANPNRQLPNGNAVDELNSYRRGFHGESLKQGGTPPVGALVYYDPHPSNGYYGHVEVHLGNGFVATTQGLPDDGRHPPNTIKQIGHAGSVAGYVRPWHQQR